MRCFNCYADMMDLLEDYADHVDNIFWCQRCGCIKIGDYLDTPLILDKFKELYQEVVY